MNKVSNVTFKIVSIIFIVCLLMCIVGCESINDGFDEDGPISQLERFSLKIIDDEDFIYDKDNYENEISPGTVIELHSYVIYDADLAMYINGERIGIQKSIETDDGYVWKYEFVMPENDVTVEFKIEGGIDVIMYETLGNVTLEDYSLLDKIVKVEYESGYIGVAPGSDVYSFESENEDKIKEFKDVFNYEIADVTDVYEMICGGSYVKLTYYYYEDNDIEKTELKNFSITISNKHLFINDRIYKVYGNLNVNICGE